MILDDTLILKLEQLSRLKLSEKERTLIKKDLNAIVKMLDTLQEVDTADTEPLTQMHDRENVFRTQKHPDSLDKSDAFGNAPLSRGPFFLVPNLLHTPDKTPDA